MGGSMWTGMNNDSLIPLTHCDSMTPHSSSNEDRITVTKAHGFSCQPLNCFHLSFIHTRSTAFLEYQLCVPTQPTWSQNHYQQEIFWMFRFCKMSSVWEENWIGCLMLYRQWRVTPFLLIFPVHSATRKFSSIYKYGKSTKSDSLCAGVRLCGNATVSHYDCYSITWSYESVLQELKWEYQTCDDCCLLVLVLPCGLLPGTFPLCKPTPEMSSVSK